MAVDLKPIFQHSLPTPLINITSPFLKRFSTNTKIPEIKFLNKSWLLMQQQLQTPRPAIIGPTLILPIKQHRIKNIN